MTVRRTWSTIALCSLTTIAVPFASCVFVQCSDFDEAAAPDGGQDQDAETGAPDAATLADTSNAGADTSNVIDTGIDTGPPPFDGGPAQLVCGGETCKLAEKNERCCLFQKTNGERSGECTIIPLGNTSADCTPDTDQIVALASTCDESADCAPGQVCCHKTKPKPSAASCDDLPTSASCVAAANCTEACSAGGGTDHIACNPARTDECPFGKTCQPRNPSPMVIIARGYCD